MARYENEGFCPNNTVRTILEGRIGTSNRILFCKWLEFGDRVVAPNCKLEYEMDEIVKLFTIDTIALPLMTTLSEKAADAEKITVKVDYFEPMDTYRNKAIENVVRSNPSATLVLARYSELAIVVYPKEDDGKEIIVQVWR